MKGYSKKSAQKNDLFRLGERIRYIGPTSPKSPGPSKYLEVGSTYEVAWLNAYDISRVGIKVYSKNKPIELFRSADFIKVKEN